MTMNFNRNKGFVAAVALAGLCACGGKTKKEETAPVESSSGEVTAESKPTEATTETPPSAGANLQDVIYFGFDQVDLDDAAKQKLSENASWLKEDAARTLTIEGHTDEVGTPEYNLGLGERRARAARDYLIALGADQGRVAIITYGEEKPASNQDEQNRRSVFIATKK